MSIRQINNTDDSLALANLTSVSMIDSQLWKKGLMLAEQRAFAEALEHFVADPLDLADRLTLDECAFLPGRHLVRLEPGRVNAILIETGISASEAVFSYLSSRPITGATFKLKFGNESHYLDFDRVDALGHPVATVSEKVVAAVPGLVSVEIEIDKTTDETPGYFLGYALGWT